MKLARLSSLVDQGNRIWLILFFLFIALFLTFAFLNYNCHVNGDPDTFLAFGKSLSSGHLFFDYPPDKLLFDTVPEDGYYQGYYYRIINGRRSFSFVSIGYPLYLVPHFWLGGIYGPFFSNILVFIGLFIAIYVFCRLAFGENPFYPAIALLALLLYFLLNVGQLSELIRCNRDPLYYLLIMIAFCCWIALARKWALKYLILSAIFMGLACTVRETSVLALPPMGLYYLSRHIRSKRRLILIPRDAALFIIVFCIALAPLLIQNYETTGNPFFPPQGLSMKVMFPEQAPDGADLETGLDDFSVPGSSFKNFSVTSRNYMRQIVDKYGHGLILLFLIGVVLGIRRDEIRFLLLPFLLVFLLFYSFYYASPWRYIFIVHMAAVIVIAFAMVRGVQILTGGQRRRGHLLLIATGFILLIVQVARTHQEDRFLARHAEMFRRDFNSAVSSNSVVIAERDMRSYIDYFTSAHSFRVDDFERPEFDLTLRNGLGFFMTSFDAVYFFDSEDMGIRARHRYNHTPVTKQRILDDFDLVPVWTFDSAKYNLASTTGREVCTLFEIRPWEKLSTSHDLHVRHPRRSILRINARNLWKSHPERTAARLYLNDKLVSENVTDGMNFFYVPRDIMEEDSVIRLESDAPVPADISPAFLDPYGRTRIQVGALSIPLDTAYIPEEFLILNPYATRRKSEPNPAWRKIRIPAQVRIPGANMNDTTVIVSVVVRPLGLNGGYIDEEISFTVNGVETERTSLFPASYWQSVAIPIDTAGFTGETAILTINAYPADASSGITVSELGLDEITITPIRHRKTDYDIDFGENDDAFIHDGFFPKETLPDGATVRWTSRSSILLLPYFGEGDSIDIEFKAFGPPANVPDTLAEIFLGDVKVGELNVPSASRFTDVIRIPANLLETGLNKLEIRSRAWSPSDYTGSGDTRDLGILLDGITVRYVVPE